jgi:hypothetical protein
VCASNRVDFDLFSIPEIVVLFPFLLISISLLIFLIFFFFEKNINFHLFIGISSCYYKDYYLRKEKIVYIANKIFIFFNKKCFIDDIFNFIAISVYKFGYFIFRSIDKGLLELLGPSGAIKLFSFLSTNLNKHLQSGFVHNYSFSIFLNIVLILFITFLIL